MKRFFQYVTIVLLTLVAYSCTDNNEVGNSLSETTIKVVADSSFTITGVSQPIPRVKARTSMQLIGTIKADNYGLLSSEVVSELMPSGELNLENVDETMVDEVRLLMFVRAGDGFTGDSIVPMRMTVYNLTKELPDPIYSDFDPTEYYDAANPLASETYTASDMDKSTADRESHFLNYFDASTYAYKYYEVREARVQLPLSFGQRIIRQYKESPETFKDLDSFRKFFPGFYIKNSFGSGRVMNFSNTEVELKFHRKYKTDFGTDTIVVDSVSCLAATPEMLSNNMIDMQIDEKLKQRVADGEALLVSPQGYQVDIKLPLSEIIAKYGLDKNDMKVINQVRLEIPAEEITNAYGMTPPANVLLVRTSEKDAFFNEHQLADGRRSYVGIYSESQKKYIFSEIRSYLMDVLNSESGLTAEDEQVSIIPVDITQEQVSSSYSYYYSSSASYVLTKVAPSVYKPSMCRLLLDQAKIVLSFTDNVSRED